MADTMTGEDWEALAKFLAGVLLWPASIVAYAFVLAVLWGWFVVPFGVQDIGMAHAYGLAVLVTMVAKNLRRDSDRSIWEDIGLRLLACGIFLLFGWIAHLLM